MTTAARPLTPRQLDIALTDLDQKLAAIDATLQSFASTWERNVPEAVGEAWNHLHDAHRALTAHREEVALNRAPLSGAEAGTAALVAQNID